MASEKRALQQKKPASYNAFSELKKAPKIEIKRPPTEEEKREQALQQSIQQTKKFLEQATRNLEKACNDYLELTNHPMSPSTDPVVLFNKSYGAIEEAYR